jgi:hypothetical protein
MHTKSNIVELDTPTYSGTRNDNQVGRHGSHIDTHLRAVDKGPVTVSERVVRRPAQPRTMDLWEVLFCTVAFIIFQNKWNHELQLMKCSAVLDYQSPGG